MTDDLFEKLAAIEHERWADWQKYVHEQCGSLMENFTHTGALVIPKELVSRWNRQIETSYVDLSEEEKESDRDQVRRYWDFVRPDQ